MRRLFLVRHAKAGDRSSWRGDDRERPLSKAGEAQSQAIAKQLERAGATELVSSPYLRCRQTLAPLAERLGRAIRDDERLAEAGSLADILELIGSVSDGSVLCSHGDVIPDVVAGLERRGAEIITPLDWRKATVWEFVFDDDGAPVTAAVTPPPAP